VSGCVVVSLVSNYPAQYLFRLDRDIWFIQVGTWIILLLEGAALSIAAAVAAAALRKWLSRPPGARPFPAAIQLIERFLASSEAPIVAGVLSALAGYYAAGSLHPVPTYHDGAAYLLQAKLYATGRWTAPPAPIPEFFEQMYVFVWPFTAAKYPPGYPLALVPGTLLGLPILAPVALEGISGGLLFALARRIGNPAIASLAWLLWITIPHDVITPPVFISQQLSTLLWLASWWALARWWKSSRPRDLLWLAFFVGWGAITRPMTMFAAAVPIGVVVLVRIARTRAWKQLVPAFAVGLVVLSLLPVWCKKTTGSWTVSPLALHVRWYTPFDALGFGWTPPPPKRTLPTDLANVVRSHSLDRRDYTLARTPSIALARAREILANTFPRWRRAFLPLLALGILCAPAEGLLAALTGALSFLLHLALAHPIKLSLYYMETYPVLAYLTVAGLWAAVAGASRRARGQPSGFQVRRASALLLLLTLALAPAAVVDLHRLHLRQLQNQSAKKQFQSTIDRLPGRSIVFVNYPPDYAAFNTLIENDPFFASEKVWIVHDLGPENKRLAAIAPERSLYRYIALERRLVPLRDGSLGRQ
jgi:hypothetical protein